MWIKGSAFTARGPVAKCTKFPAAMWIFCTNRRKIGDQVFNNFLTNFQQISKISTIFPWKICGKFVENVGNVKVSAFTHVDITRLGGRLSRSCKGAGSCDFVKELGRAAVKELRFTGAALRSCARICQGAGNGSWKNFPYFLFFPFHYSTLCDFCQGAAYAHIWNICSIFSKRKSPRSWQAPGVCGILWPSPHGLGHFIWSP